MTGLTPEQIRMRVGCVTASNMPKVLSFLKSGKSSEERESYKKQILAERLTDQVADHYVTPAMQHGIEQEQPAKDAYSFLTGNLIEPMPTLAHPRIEHFLATPDGRIAPHVGVEVKCPTSAKFIAWKLAGIVPEEHKPQMLAQCLVAGFREVEFIAFDPRMPEEQQLFVRRFIPTADELAAAEKAVVAFLEEVEAMWEALINAPVVA